MFHVHLEKDKKKINELETWKIKIFILVHDFKNKPSQGIETLPDERHSLPQWQFKKLKLWRR